MASPDIFAFGRSALNPFLYADIGPQDVAGTLTVASLFGRHGRDPWEEAARLARLPSGGAAASLALMIEAMATQHYSPQDATSLAASLVTLLPKSPGGTDPGREPAGRFRSRTFANFALGLGVLVALVAVWLAAADAWRPRSPADHERLDELSAYEASPQNNNKDGPVR